ncbi:MAG: hypothetical protein JXA52_06380 [Planctomycetes bacterium]|nr:hypothetical protein [Planctomycetota bacterium]
MRVLQPLSKIFLIVFVIGMLLGFCGEYLQAEEPGKLPPALSAHDKVMVIKFHGTIIPDIAALRWLAGEVVVTDKDVETAVEKAEYDGARLIVLEIDSPGGVVDTCNNICRTLIDCPIPTVALVTKQAISGGSMVATACDEIVMVKGSIIGDCEPHAINMKLEDYMREKVESTIRGRMRANAETKGYPPKLLEAMVTKSIALYYIEYEDGAGEFLKREELELLEKQIQDGESQRKIADRTLVCPEGRLLTLTAGEAQKYGLIKEVTDSVGKFYADREINASDRFVMETPQEESSGLLSKEISIKWQMLLVLCLVIGIAGVIVEASVPGFGVPGIIGIIGFSCFFAILFLHGRAEFWEIGLFLAGIVFILMELFIFPGFGVSGILGILCIFASLAFSYLLPFDALSMQGAGWQNEVNRMITFFGLGSLLAIVLGWLLAKYLVKVPILGKIILTSSLRSGSEVIADVAAEESGRFPHEVHRQESELQGVTGVAATDLRPAGKMRTDDGKTLDVVSDGGLLKKDTPVKIVEVNGPRITVTKLED